MTHAGLRYFLQADIKTMTDVIYDQVMVFFLRKGASLDFHEFTVFSKEANFTLKSACIKKP